MNVVRTKLGEGGRVILPASFRHNLHLSAGDDILLRIENDSIYITTPEQALAQFQKEVKKHIDIYNTSKDSGQITSLVDELITQRRHEVENE